MTRKTRAALMLESASPTEGAGFVRPGARDVLALAETRGAVFVEYVALLTLVTIMGAAAVLSLGVPLLNLFKFQQLILTLPFP